MDGSHPKVGLRADKGAAPDRPGAFDARGHLRLRRRRRGRVRRRILAGAVTATLIVGVYAGVGLYSARTDLLAARAELTSGVGALAAGNAESAYEAFDIAGRSARSAESRLSDPVMRLVGALPLAGHTAHTARDVAASAGLVADAGKELSAAAIALPEGLAALAPRDGRIPVRSIAAVAPALESAHALISQAHQRMINSPSTALAAPVATARSDLLGELNTVEPQLENAAAVAGALPSFLGADRPRRYFFGAQNPAELRGTGGFIGAYAILTVDDGALDFSPFQSIVDLSPLPVGGVESPSDEYRRLYGAAGGAGFGQNANMTPDVPTAARALQRLYERVHDRPLDGAILADPHAFAALLAIAGPVEIEGVGTVTTDTVVGQIANEAYALLPDSNARKELLGGVAAATLTRFLSDGASQDPLGAAGALIDSAGAGHIRFHANDEDVMAAFDVAGVTGRLESPYNLLAVVGNNIAQNKVDFYTDRHVTHDVWLQADGSAIAQTKVRLANHAPRSGQPLDVIGPNLSGLQPGENRTLLSVYCSSGCRRLTTERDGQPVEPLLTATELGYPVVMTAEQMTSQDARTVIHRFRVDDAWDPGERVYRSRILDQPTIRPTMLEVTVHSPEGLLVRGASDGMAVRNESAHWEGALRGPVDVEVVLGRPATSAWQQMWGALTEPAFTIGG